MLARGHDVGRHTHSVPEGEWMVARAQLFRFATLAGLIALVAGVCFFWLKGTPSTTTTPPPAAFDERPRLAVVVVFDQMRGDYLQRWQDLFEPGGFRRLQQEGA